MHMDFINTLLDAGRDISMRYFRTQGLDVDTKSDNTPVSIADKKAEHIIRQCIQQSYPDHGIIGEEFGTENTDAEYVWIIDPIDGTKAFIDGKDTFANMVCLLHQGTPIISGIGFPARSERYIAIDGKTYLNGVPISITPHPIKACNIAYTGIYMFNSKQLLAVKNLQSECLGEIVGSDAYSYCRLCAGDNKVVCEADLQPYDFLPLIPVVQNAGGRITDWQGRDLHMNSTGEVVASSAEHDSIIKVLKP